MSQLSLERRQKGDKEKGFSFSADKATEACNSSVHAQKVDHECSGIIIQSLIHVTVCVENASIFFPTGNISLFVLGHHEEVYEAMRRIIGRV